MLTHGALRGPQLGFSLKNDNHLYAQYSSLTVKFASPFSLYVYISIRSYARFSLFNFLSLTIFLNLEEVKSVLNEVGEGTFEVFLMIDAIQRLGIDYHFHDEIEAILQRFRLLRQEGYYVTAVFLVMCMNELTNVFNFKDKKGKFEEKLGIVDDFRGIISLSSSSILCNAFLVEAKWFVVGHVPKTDDYLKNGIISSGVHVVLVHMFFLLGHGITKRNVGIVDDFRGIISFAATILRLWDDLGSAKDSQIGNDILSSWLATNIGIYTSQDENQDGHDGSYIECYMKEHPGTPIENARCHLLNQQCLAPNPFSTCFTKACLNVARMVPLMYSYDDNQCLPSLEEHMKSLVEASVSSQSIPPSRITLLKVHL
ncbi:hypothetical protein AAG906_028404 [Vitis piasezkii]